MDKFDDDFELDEFEDADDDELFEKESQAEDFEERMARETEAYLKGVNDGDADSYNGVGFGQYDDVDEFDSDEERDRYEAGYYDGYDADEDDYDE